MIPQSKIDEILNAAHIEDVVGHYVSLKKRGTNMLGLCPFHNEKTPSFNVSPSKGIFKCFGCGKGGNSVNFIMEYEHLGYIQALKHLAELYRIEWPEESISDEALEEEKRKRNEKDSLQIINNFAEEYFKNILETDEEGKSIGLSYFEERGFRPEIISKFRLGFSKDGWDNFTNTALQNGYSEELLIKSGLVKKSEQGKVYDAYRGRVMFPIHGLSGKPIAFAGRHLKGKEEKSPKYVNSPETELYHKSNELYGLFFARKAISVHDYTYLVEGYTDVISMHQAGVENVVASSGTSLTENQIKLIKRFSDNVCVLYDGDAAGIKASLRGIDMLLEGGLNVKVVLFPDGEDPDSYYRKNGELAFQEFLASNKQDFILFKTGLLSADSGNDPVKRAELIRNIVESISKVPDAFKRANFIKECGRILKVEEQLLISEANRILRNRLSAEAKTQIEAPAEQPLNYEEELQATTDLRGQDSQERDLLRIILRYGDHAWDDFPNAASFIFAQLSENEIEIENPVISELLNVLHNQILNENKFEPQRLLQHEDPRITSFLADLFTDKYSVSHNWETRYGIFTEMPEEHYKADVLACLTRLQLKHIDKLIMHNQEDISKCEDDDEIMILVQADQNLKQIRKDLASRFGTAIIK